MPFRFVRALIPVPALLMFWTHAGPTVSAHTAVATVSGIVIDSATRRPLSSAQVVIRDLNLGATTTTDGSYQFSVPVDSVTGRDVTLLVRLIGYQPTSRQVHLTNGRNTQNFAVIAAQLRLEAVVVTGTASRTVRSTVGSSVAQVSAAPAMSPSPPPPAPTSIAIRGQASINAAAPLPPPMAMGRAAKRAKTNVALADTVVGNTEGYDVIAENPFLTTAWAPRSTFSIDVDHASYSNVRRFLTGGNPPPRDAVRIEELINYFPYDLPAPTGKDPVSITTEVSTAPWNPSHQLVRVGLRGRPIEVDRLPPNNLVFLIDVSGSMMDPNKLPLLKSAFSLLVNELRPQDRVALVVYAGNAGLVLPSTPGDHKGAILDAIERLEAGGSTAGGAGIRLAYDVARENFMKRGNNRVILATDGDFNVGTSSDAELVQLIEQRRTEGTFLTVLGFGTGNVKDSKMEKLADNGNGNYAYVDNISEARKVLVTEMGATLVTIAKDVKLQIEFNPSRVGAYRLLGYENRMLRDEDFRDDTKDAGELGAGHTVTALYELIPPGSPHLAKVPRPDSLRYTRPASSTPSATTSELLYVKLRYKEPTGSESTEMTHVVRDETTRASSELAFASAVAEFGMVLRDSPHRGQASIDSVIVRAERSRGADPFGYRAEFVSLARIARDVLSTGRVAGR